MEIIPKILTDLDRFEERTDEVTSEVSLERVKHVISLIKKVLYANPDVPALCAPQIGEDLRLFVVRNSKTEHNRFKVFLNPLTVSSEGWHLSREANPSLPDKQFIIPRRDKVHVAYQETQGEVNSETFIGAYAEVVQQMIEMLDGITLADYGLDLDDLGGAKAFDKAKKADKVEVLAMYMDSLKETAGILRDEIKADENLSYLNDMIDFRTGVLEGKITPIKKGEETCNSNSMPN